MTAAVVQPQTPVAARRHGWIAPAAVGLLALPLLLLDAAPPREGAAMGAFMPGASLETVAGAIAPLDGRILGEGRLPGLWLIRAEGPGLPAALRRAGALIVFDPDRLPGCFDLSTFNRQRALP